MSSVERILLGLGLALREYEMAHFTAPDEVPTDFPEYANTTTIMGYNSILGALTMVVLDLEK